MASSEVRRVTQITEIKTLFVGCWHIDTKSTPRQRRNLVLLKPGDPEPAWTFRVESEARTEGTCRRCTEKLRASRQELNEAGREVWTPRLSLALCEAFDVFHEAEQQLLVQFCRACRAAVEGQEQQDWYHTEPLARYTRQLHQLVLFGNELQREVVAHRDPRPALVEAVILVLGRAFVRADIWKDQTDGALRDGLELAVPAIMDLVLAMRPNANLHADVEVVMAEEFKKAGIY